MTEPADIRALIVKQLGAALAAEYRRQRAVEYRQRHEHVDLAEVPVPDVDVPHEERTGT
jgi:hypothetical protein